MTFNEYQKLTNKTAIFRDSIQEITGPGPVDGSGEEWIEAKLLRLAYVGLGLGEVGEIQGKIKKIIRDSKGVITSEHRAAIKKELGDLLWYVSETATELGLQLDDVAEGNIDKLFSRKERGVLQGSGDER